MSISLVVIVILSGPVCGLGGCAPEPTNAPAPTELPAPTDTPTPANATPPSPTSPPIGTEQENEEAPEQVDYDTVFPLPENVQNFTGEGGESQINFQTSLTMDEVIAFYRQAFAEMDLSEYEILTAIEEEGFSVVFTGWPNGEELVIQGVAFGESTNVNVRLEEVVDS
jgi:hypothetical protein